MDLEVLLVRLSHMDEPCLLLIWSRRAIEERLVMVMELGMYCIHAGTVARPYPLANSTLCAKAERVMRGYTKAEG